MPQNGPARRKSLPFPFVRNLYRPIENALATYSRKTHDIARFGCQHEGGEPVNDSVLASSPFVCSQKIP
jgi:hypothetical protein